jgi:hypothetical protein
MIAAIFVLRRVLAVFCCSLLSLILSGCTKSTSTEDNRLLLESLKEHRASAADLEAKREHITQQLALLDQQRKELDSQKIAIEAVRANYLEFLLYCLF